MKKIISIFLVVCCLFSLCGCKDNVPYNKSANPVSDFDYTIDKDKGATIMRYIGKGEEVVVPDKIEGFPVKYIGYSAFYGTDVEKVKLPSTVTTIAREAFFGCQSLKEVVLENGVQVIEKKAFYGCTALETISFPGTLESIEDSAFEGCSSLKKITIPKSVTKVGMQAFYKAALSELVFEDGIKEIGAYAAFWCGEHLKTVTIPASVEKIGETPFNDKLESVTFLGAPPKIAEIAYPFGADTVIYYYAGTAGWDSTQLKDMYTLKELPAEKDY